MVLEVLNLHSGIRRSIACVFFRQSSFFHSVFHAKWGEGASFPYLNGEDTASCDHKSCMLAFNWNSSYNFHHFFLVGHVAAFEWRKGFVLGHPGWISTLICSVGILSRGISIEQCRKFELLVENPTKACELSIWRAWWSLVVHNFSFPCKPQRGKNPTDACELFVTPYFGIRVLLVNFFTIPCILWVVDSWGIYLVSCIRLSWRVWWHIGWSCDCWRYYTLT